ncbi:JAB domain-containing protein [Pedobacter aquatilis]|uniref:JAB domain-containing protein n=1 Tax=Pedobacter aquatilis TaxID=351343 RepID=UPI0025B2E70D|nr:JAB domain-containing protein [Pedobacter aquatilis]MDN3585659.1 JAB domain-containing protein [Pedobacter aquatilis]
MKTILENSLFSVSEIKVSYQPGFNVSERPKVTASNDAYRIFNAHWNHDVIEMTEQFYVLLLNNAGRVLGIQQISSGSSNGTLVDPKLVFAVALKTFCAGMILAHNHPSQNLVPKLVFFPVDNERVSLSWLRAWGEIFLEALVMVSLLLFRSRFFKYSTIGLFLPV